MVLENLKRPPKPGSRIFVGLSGGLDSVALLHLINEKILKSKTDSPWFGLKVKAIHVNHGLQTCSNNFEFTCKEICKKMGIELKVERLNIPNELIKKIGMEAAARKERFNAFNTILEKDADILALGHHLDDQIETFFLQWIRGSGLEGLTGMLIFDEKIINQQNLNVWRPLLEITKSVIFDYAVAHKLEWIEDPTNQNLEHDRNLIRHKVMPILKLIRNGSPLAMNRSIHHLQSARLLLENVTSSALDICEIDNSSELSHVKVLSKNELLQFDDELIPRVLRAWLTKMGCSVPPTRRLREFIRQLRCSTKKKGCLIEVNGENGYRIMCNFNEITLTIK